MEPVLRPIERHELEPWLRMLELSAGRRMSDAVFEDAAEMYALDRTLAAFDGDRIVAGNASDLLSLTVPGPAVVPAARITLTAVLPTHRRRGLASALFAHQVEDLRRRGEPLAIFTTTGPGLYRRAGYSPASVAAEVEIESAYGALEPGSEPLEGVRVLQEDELPRVLPDVFERHRVAQPGQVERTDAFWRIWLLDRPQFRRGEPGDRFAAVFEDENSSSQGYVAYRLRPGPPRDQPVQTLVVEEVVAVTDAARRALWAYCFAFGQAMVVTAPNVPIDEPAGWMLADPRRLRTLRVRDFLWLRLLDVAAALAARRYSATDALVLDVDDATCADNSSRFRLEATADEPASCEPTTAPPDLTVRVEDLAAAYLGGTSFRTLARAGRVVEHSQGAVERCDRSFASWPAPWTVTDW